MKKVLFFLVCLFIILAKSFGQTEIYVFTNYSITPCDTLPRQVTIFLVDSNHLGSSMYNISIDSFGVQDINDSINVPLDTGWHTINIISYYGDTTEYFYIDCGTAFVPNYTDINVELFISPNPFTTSAHIVFDQTYQSIAAEVYDIEGKLLLQNHYTDCKQIELKRGNLSEGLYFLKITLDDKAVETRKIIINN